MVFPATSNKSNMFPIQIHGFPNQKPPSFRPKNHPSAKASTLPPPPFAWPAPCRPRVRSTWRALGAVGVAGCGWSCLSFPRFLLPSPEIHRISTLFLIQSIMLTPENHGKIMSKIHHVSHHFGVKSVKIMKKHEKTIQLAAFLHETMWKNHGKKHLRFRRVSGAQALTTTTRSVGASRRQWCSSAKSTSDLALKPLASWVDGWRAPEMMEKYDELVPIKWFENGFHGKIYRKK